MSDGTKDLVERMARAISRVTHDVDGFLPWTDDYQKSLQSAEDSWTDYKPEARAAIRAVAGWLMDLPPEHTDDYNYDEGSFDRLHAIYQALIDALDPPTPEDK